jgi:hypothetical protein
VTELYNYSEASRRGEYEEAYLKNSFEKNQPADVFHARGANQTAVQGLVFKLVSMYAIPHGRKRARRRNRYDEGSEDDMAGEDYLRHAEQKLGVLADLGTYMTIHSQAVLKALRTIIPTHPDLPRLAETRSLCRNLSASLYSSRMRLIATLQRFPPCPLNRLPLKSQHPLQR